MHALGVQNIHASYEIHNVLMITNSFRDEIVKEISLITIAIDISRHESAL